MNAWIFSHSDELSERIRDSLARSCINCSAKEIESGFEWDAERVPAAEGEILFYAVPIISDADIDILRRIKSSSKAFLIVVGSGSDNATVLKAIRAGATDFINAGTDLPQEIAACVSRIASELMPTESKTQVVSIVPCHVPSDANVLAVNIAAVAAQRLGSSGLLDFQLRGSDLALLLKLTPRHTLYDLITECESIDDAMFRQSLTPHDSGIHLLAGPELFSDLRGVQPQLCEEILLRSKAAFPFVVIVTEDIQHSEQIYALNSSQHILLAMRLDLVSLHRAKRHFDFLSENQIDMRRIHVVAMGTGLPGELEESAVKRVFCGAMVHFVPDDAVAVTASINMGNPIVMESPRSKASRAICRLVSTLAGWPDSVKAGEHLRPLSAAKAAAVLAANALSFCR